MQKAAKKMAINKFRKVYNSIPKHIRVFLLRALLIFIVWETAYIFLLQQSRVIDQPLTNLTAFTTAKVFSWFSNMPITPVYTSTEAAVFVNGKKTIGILDGCNALELFILYVGFLLAMPTNRKNFWLFTIGGVISIFILNIARCSALTGLFLHHASISDFAHHYLFKIIVYGYIFFMWVWYSEKYVLK